MEDQFTDNERKLAGALSAALAVAGPEWMVDAAMKIAELTEENALLSATADMADCVNERLCDEIDRLKMRTDDLGHTVQSLRDSLEYQTKENDRLRTAINGGAGIPQMVDGNAITLAVVAYRRINSKIDMIKEFRKITGLGLRESKEICEQVIRAMDSAVALAKEDAV